MDKGKVNGTGRKKILRDRIRICACLFLALFLISGCIEQDNGPESAVKDSGDETAPESTPPESDIPETPPESDILETTEPPLPAADIIITVVYDNNPYNPELTPEWGFSCLIEGCEKTILFDTGGNSTTLSRNMQKLGINPDKIDFVVLSHIHGDHVDGLPAVLSQNSDVTVFVPISFPFSFKEDVKNQGADVAEVSTPVKICENVYSTGQMSGPPDEQSLILRTDRGLIIITGCAHPGVARIVKKAKDLLQDDILFVMGGFHLGDATSIRIREIISDFRDLGVLYAGSCHCTGEYAMELFEEEYGEYYVEIGVGTIIYVKDLV